jgi:hypothetical protein
VNRSRPGGAAATLARNAMLAAALELAARFYVLPVRGKLPAIPERDGGHGWLDATTDPDLIRDRWRRYPDAQPAIACRPSGFIALDVDPRHGDDDRLHDLEQRLGPLPRTVRALTGGGGEHILLKHPAVDLAHDVDRILIRDRGYIVAPPSVHPDTGRPYVWSVDGHPDDVPLAPIPPAWLDAMRKPTAPEPVRTHEQNNAGDGWLATRPPQRYIAELFAVKVPTAPCTIRCPLPDHPDRTPSFRVYATAAEGWYCYGCRRGGTIYDLAAIAWGIPRPLRDSAFLTVRGALNDLYERLLGADK